MIPKLYLTFHGIGPVPNHVPSEEHPYWISETAFSEFIDTLTETSRASGVQITVTFDDGNVSDRNIAAPMLAESGIPAIFFPCAARVGTVGYLDREDIVALDEDGFEIGSHGVEHVPWRGLPTDMLEREVADSKSFFEEMLGKPVHSAALPFGSYDSKVLAALRRAGYQTVFSSDPGASLGRSSFKRRWSYRSDKSFDVLEIARESFSIRNKVMSEVKRVMKSLR
ncbi:MAG: polysaccharide deacetylase family protein [Pseudomonadota bacterium]